MTDNDTVRRDHITGHDIRSNITTERADKARDIIELYDCRMAAEATGCCVGHSVSNVGTVAGVMVTSTFETEPDT